MLIKLDLMWDCPRISCSHRTKFCRQPVQYRDENELLIKFNFWIEWLWHFNNTSFNAYEGVESNVTKDWEAKQAQRMCTTLTKLKWIESEKKAYVRFDGCITSVALKASLIPHCYYYYSVFIFLSATHAQRYSVF